MWYFANGDAGFYFTEQLRQLSWLPTPWYAEYGFGLPALSRMWFDYPYILIIKILSFIGLSWWLIDKILWVSVFTLSIYSSYKLARYIVGNSKAVWLASIVYSVNTYILLLFSGGQVGVALAYGFAPFVLLKFIRAIDVHDAHNSTSVLKGLFFALLVAFDLRLAFLTYIASALYFGYTVIGNGIKKISTNRLVSDIIHIFIFPLIISVGLHMFWILPSVLASGGISDLGEQFTNPGMLAFLSVADFPHTIGLLHPNWPENLFGKVYFMQPEFLVLPFLGFASLLFIGSTKNDKKQATREMHVLFFALLTVLGAFLSKGVNEPLGGIFQWMFTHVPGFIMFRDPTKFYLFTAIGYSILIPSTLDRVTYRVRQSMRYIIFFAFIGFWLFTVRGVFTGQVRGNFRPLELTSEYVRLKDMLVSDTTPSRTVWIPQRDAFVYTSDTHPLLNADQLFDNASNSGVIEMIKKPDFIKRLSESGVGYVIVPADLERGIFLSDYQFNPRVRNDFIQALKQTPLKQDNYFGGIAVFKNDAFNMKSTTPQIVDTQKRMANIGITIGIVTLLAGVGIIALTRRK